MVVLNCYGKIDKICISTKLGLYLSNLPDSPENNWKKQLEKELKLSYDVNRIYQEYLGTNHTCGINKLYHNVFSQKRIPDDFSSEQFSDLASKMVCLFLDYSYDDMPLGGWEQNCFDGRLCEDDYTEKIIDFWNYLSNSLYNKESFPGPIPQWIYSSNHDEIDHYRLFWGGEGVDIYIRALKEWGELLDKFLENRENYLLFDYLVNSVYKDNKYNEYHFMKDYSLCQLFLEDRHEKELDKKLQHFLPEYLSVPDKEQCAKLLRQLRNKIAHGDFLAFETKIEEFAVQFMDGKFGFDYSEYSRKNWAISHICCLMDDVLRCIIYMLFYDNEILNKIKKDHTV